MGINNIKIQFETNKFKIFALKTIYSLIYLLYLFLLFLRDTFLKSNGNFIQWKLDYGNVFKLIIEIYLKFFLEKI